MPALLLSLPLAFPVCMWKDGELLPNINDCRLKPSYDYSGPNAVDKLLKTKHDELGAHLWPIFDMRGLGIKVTEAHTPVVHSREYLSGGRNMREMNSPFLKASWWQMRMRRWGDEKVGQIRKQQQQTPLTTTAFICHFCLDGLWKGSLHPPRTPSCTRVPHIQAHTTKYLNMCVCLHSCPVLPGLD